jgi:hypothetical protein
MSDVFGGGLDTQSGSPAYSGDGSGVLPAGGLDMPTAAPAALAPQPPAQSDPSFGSAFISPLPNYKPLEDPKATALDQSANLLEQRVDRTSKIATASGFGGFLMQIFAPDALLAARDDLPKLTEQLQTIKTQKQQQVDIQNSATNFGMPASAQNPFMTNDTVDNWLLDQYKSGDFSKAKYLQARGKGDWVQDFAGTAVDGAGARLAAASTAITKLNAAGDNQPAYASVLRSLTPEEKQSITSLGFQTIPEKVSDWQAGVQQHGAAFTQAQQLHSQVTQKLNNITNFDGTAPKDVEVALQGDIRVGSSNEPAGFPVRTRSIDGQTGNVGPNGSVQVEKYGLAPKDGGWNATTAERLEKSDKMFAGDDQKGAISQYNIANKFRNEAMNDQMYNSSAGLALLKDTLGAVGRDVAEKSAAAGTTGLSQMFGKQQGGFEGFLNRATSELGAYKNWVDGGRKGDAPRISDETKRGMQFIANENYKYAQEQATGRLSGAMRYAGQIGRPLEDIPLDASLKDSVAQYHEEGRVDAINGWRSYPSVVRGNQRIFFPQGSNVNGAQPPRPPLTPVQQPAQNTNAQPPAVQPVPSPINPQAPQTPPGGGTGQPSQQQPITVAGQQVNMTLPPGASPAYVASLQNIETPGKANPWAATTANSSAGGAFQAIKATWDANKPPGAPARAQDATPQQQADFLSNLTTKNAATLTNLKLPVNDTTLYMAHNVGANGAASLLSTSPTADARTVVGEAAAKNNPLFFRGRPTVATVLQRYADAVGSSAGAQPGSPAPNITPMQRESLARRGVDTSAPGPTPEQQAGQWAQTGQDLAGVAPAALSTVGALGGGLAGPVGAVAGGAVGGYVGNAAKNYMRGKPQNQVENAEQAALGGLLSVAGPARLATKAGLGVLAGQTAGSAAIEAGTAGAEGGTPADMVDAGLRGGAEGLGGRLFGHALGMGLNKVYSLFTTDAQKTVQAAAKDLHEANQTLATTEPKLPGEGAGDNPKYVAAQAAKDKAEATIKDMLPNAKPDEVAYAHKVTSEGDVPRGEAVVMGRARSAANETSQGYNQLRQDVQNTGVGVPKANQPTPDGPLAQIRTSENPTGTVEAKFVPDAEHAEMLVKAPADNWSQKWQQLQNAGSELIQKRMAFLQNADKPSADAMDNIFQGVRNQQVAAAKYVFGPARAPQVIDRLEQLDKSWATIMTGSGGMNYARMQQLLEGGNSPARRAMETAFKSFAGDDPGAMRAFNAMKVGAPADWKLMLPVIAGELSANAAGVPTLGALSATAAAGIGGQRIYRVMRQYMNAKVLGQPVQFKDFFMKDLQSDGTLKAITGNVAQRGAVQGDVLRSGAVQ